MISPFEFLIVALAGWRLGYFATHEKGPFGLMGRLRAKTTLGGLLSCYKCATFWTIGAMYLLVLTPLLFIPIIFGAAGAALMLASFSGVSNDKS